MDAASQNGALASRIAQEPLYSAEEVEPFQGYKVTVFVPESAPEGTGELVFDMVFDIIDDMDFKDVDLMVSGGPADYESDAAFMRKVDEVDRLKREVKTLKGLLTDAGEFVVANEEMGTALTEAQREIKTLAEKTDRLQTELGWMRDLLAPGEDVVISYQDLGEALGEAHAQIEILTEERDQARQTKQRDQARQMTQLAKEYTDD